MEISSAIKIIDDNANQLIPLLTLDQKSANLFIQEILDETQLNIKLEKLLKLLMDQIKNHSIQSVIYFDQLISDLSKMFPSIPKTPSDCAEWIKEKLTFYLEAENEFKNTEKFLLTKLNHCQEHLRIARQMVEAYESNQNCNSNADLLNKKDQIIISLNQQISEYRKKISIYEQTIEEKNQLILSLQRLKKKEQHDVSNANSLSDNEIIEKLYNNQNILKQKIQNQKQKYNKLKQETEKTIRLYKEKIERQKAKLNSYTSSMNQLKQLHCGCFDNNDDIIIAHKQLHEEIGKLKNEIADLKQINNSDFNLDGLNIQIEAIQNELTNKNSNVIQKSTTIISKENTKVSNQQLESKQDIKSNLECQGISFNVNALRKQFDNLENKIDTLHSTLVKTDE